MDIRYQGEASARLVGYLFPPRNEESETAPSSTSANFTYRLIENDADKSFDLYAGEELEMSAISGPEMALYLLNQTCYQLTYYSNGGLMLHAGLVCRRGQGLLLPGTTGRGKSTLTAWLLRCGFDYLTDELVFIPEDSLEGYGLGRPLNLKHGARLLKQGIFGFPLDDPYILRTATVDLIPAEKFRVHGDISSTMLTAIVFPEFKNGADFSFSPMTRAQAGFGLMQCLINARNLPGHGFSNTADLARFLPAFRMIYGDFNQIGLVFDRLIDPSN